MRLLSSPSSLSFKKNVRVFPTRGRQLSSSRCEGDGKGIRAASNADARYPSRAPPRSRIQRRGLRRVRRGATPFGRRRRRCRRLCGRAAAAPREPNSRRHIHRRRRGWGSDGVGSDDGRRQRRRRRVCASNRPYPGTPKQGEQHQHSRSGIPVPSSSPWRRRVRRRRPCF